MAKLKKMLEYLIREILGAHSKTAIEMIYLETGATPLSFIIKRRRMSYCLCFGQQSYIGQTRHYTPSKTK